MPIVAIVTPLARALAARPASVSWSVMPSLAWPSESSSSVAPGSPAARRTGHETTLEARAADPEDERVDWKTDQLAQQEHRRDEERGDASAFLAWGLPQLTNERRRKAVEDMLDGVPAEETAEGLGIEVGNLYQLRTRGLKDLAKLRGQWYG